MTNPKIGDINLATDVARPPLPPFTKESAIQKVRLAEDAWNTRDPQKVGLEYSRPAKSRARLHDRFPLEESR